MGSGKMGSLKGRHALVLAASKGLGLACATKFAEAGASLHLLARDATELEKVSRELSKAYSVECNFTALDLSDGEQLSDFVKGYTKPVDILLSNCGGPPVGPIDGFCAADWQAAFESIVLSVAISTAAFVPLMAERGWGRVLMIGSSVVSAPMSGFALSNVLRKGLVGFSESITQEFAAEGVTANLLNPGITRTARLERLIKLKAENLGVSEAEIEAQFLHSVPVNRFGNPNELASLATFLASEEAAFITGQSINVDGGQSVFG